LVSSEGRTFPKPQRGGLQKNAQIQSNPFFRGYPVILGWLIVRYWGCREGGARKREGKGMCLWLNTGDSEEVARHCEHGPADGEALYPGKWGD